MNAPFESHPRGALRSLGTWMDADKESIRWQFFALLQKPHVAFRYFGLRRHESGMWPRGHFKFVLFEHFLVFILMLFYYVYPEFPFSVRSVLWNFSTVFVRDFLLLDCAVATLTYFCMNRWGLAVRPHREFRQDVEWRSCLDAFSNGGVAMIWDFVIGYFFVHSLEVAFQSWFTAVLLPNTVFFFAIAHFLYMFVGTLNVLPFITKLTFGHFLVPTVCGYVLSLIFSWRIPLKVMSLHFA